MSEIDIPRENWFSAGEYRRRLQCVRSAMRESGLDALVVLSPANCYYLTGHHSIDSWEFRAAVITHDRDPALLLYQFERGRFLASSWLREACFYEAGDVPAEQLIALLTGTGLGNGHLGIEPHASLGQGDRQLLERAMPQAKLQSIGRLVERIRLRKSEEELVCIRRAAEFTEAGMTAARQAVHEGARDNDIAAAALSAMLAAGSHHPVMPPTVAAGYRSGLAHSEHDGVTLGRGDSVFIELSGCWRHYSAPLMHTATIGPPSELYQQMLGASHRVADVILGTARPGMPASEVATAAHRAMADIEGQVQFHYNFGYSLGISFPPHWLEESGFHIKENNPAPLEQGMVFHAALTMRVLGRFAAGTSRTFEITAEGARALTGGQAND